MADCKNCTTESRDNAPSTVPYIVFETAQARNERTTKRLIISIIVTVALLFATNAIWIYSWMQYDYTSYEVSAEGGGHANYIGNDGDIYNGSVDTSPETNTEK